MKNSDDLENGRKLKPRNFKQRFVLFQIIVELWLQVEVIILYFKLQITIEFNQAVTHCFRIV